VAALAAEHAEEIRKLKAAQTDREAALKRDHQRALAELQAQYNPVFREGPLTEILSRPRTALEQQAPEPYREILGAEEVRDRESYQDLARQARDLETLTQRLLEVPYGGSVPDALVRIQDAGRVLTQGYGEVWTELADRLEERTEDVQSTREQLSQKEAEIGRVYEATDRLARDTRENGYVLDPYDPQSVLLQVSRLHAPTVGDLVYVFHEDDRLVATLLITTVNQAVRARTLQLANDERPIRAFDKILLAGEANG
jgi:hypothetical protein